MGQRISIVLIAVGGYGLTYVNALLDSDRHEEFKIEGVVDPFAETCERIADIRAQGIPMYDTLEQFYESHTADLAVISSPIHLHCAQTCLALAHGANVLCEKPVSATIQEARQMMDARDKAGKLVAIGYQWSYTQVIQMLKAEMMADALGKPLRAKSITLWPRDSVYYARNRWAGMQKEGGGRWVLDSPVNNATAHYLHNMFYVLGETVNSSAHPADVTAELYRANAITNYDTGTLRCHTQKGVEVLFITTHASRGLLGPFCVFECENGVARLNGHGPEVEIVSDDGSVRRMSAGGAHIADKLWDTMAAIRGDGDVVCPLEAAAAQTLCMNGAQDCVSEIAEYPPDLIKTLHENQKSRVYVEGLDDTLKQCFEQNCLPSELGVPWAVAGRQIDLSNYTCFPGGRPPDTGDAT